MRYYLFDCSKKRVTRLLVTTKTLCQDSNDHLMMMITFFEKIVTVIIEIIWLFLFNHEQYRMKQELMTEKIIEFRL